MYRLLKLALGATISMLSLAGILARPAPGTADPVAAATHSSSNPWAYDAPTSKPTAAAASGRSPGEVIAIARDSSGQFHLDAQVNGQDARFLVDTGADTVAINEEEAQRLGIDLAGADFQPIVQTAAGQGLAARVRIDRLTIGGTDLGGVSALVIRGLPVNLLGQSVLRRLGKVELNGDRMVIQPG
jgi:aspartyl protease family protein